ncbi:Hydroxyacylglutathione hydrolase [Novosphingobium sp. CECT 9465]|nr:Hydroxyacylglutathione hydrolase [Novosphingobium sp. CECT 9465]
MVCRINEQGFQHSVRYKHERDCAVIFINGQQQGNMGQEGGHFITDGNAIGGRQERVRGIDGSGPDGKGARCIVRPGKAQGNHGMQTIRPPTALQLARVEANFMAMNQHEAQPPMKVAIIPVTPLEQNCTLVWCTRTMKGAFIDAGGDIEKLKLAVERSGVTVEKLLVTHGHVDHCGVTGILAKDLGVPIEGPHEADRFWISRLDDDGRRWGITGEVFEPDRWLSDGDKVTIGELELDVVHCPGHTPGHVVFHHAPSRFAIVGDVLFQGSIGRTDFPMGNHQDLLDSITQKLWPLGDDTMFVPGHGPHSTFGRERQTNSFVSDFALKQ